MVALRILGEGSVFDQASNFSVVIALRSICILLPA